MLVPFRWKRIRRSLLMICGCALLGILTGCYTYTDVAKAPFSSTGCRWMMYTDAVAELQEAGFTNIKTIKTGTPDKEKDGLVISVTIDGETLYREASSWDAARPVLVNSYEFKQFSVTMAVSVSGTEGYPEFVVETNLPDKTKLTLTLSGADLHTEQQTITIKDGTATSEAFRTEHNGILIGEYTLTVEMDPNDQPKSVKSEIGDDGEFLTGAYIEHKSTPTGNRIYMEVPYSSPYEYVESIEFDTLQQFFIGLPVDLTMDELEARIQDAELYHSREEESGYVLYMIAAEERKHSYGGVNGKRMNHNAVSCDSVSVSFNSQTGELEYFMYIKYYGPYSGHPYALYYNKGYFGNPLLWDEYTVEQMGGHYYYNNAWDADTPYLHFREDEDVPVAYRGETIWPAFQKCDSPEDAVLRACPSLRWRLRYAGTDTES